MGELSPDGRWNSILTSLGLQMLPLDSKAREQLFSLQFCKFTFTNEISDPDETWANLLL